jgi:uncharacterized protein (TIGR02118 family)
MLHIYYFIRRKASLSETEFARYWREVHGPLVAKVPQLKAYVQCRRLDFPGLEPSHDGVAELWVRDEAALAELRRSPEFARVETDAANFIQPHSGQLLVTVDDVLLDGPQAEGAIKALFIFKRPRGMSLKAMRAHWRDVHGPIVLRLKNARRYVESPTVDRAYDFAEPLYDGAGELWFDSVKALKETLGSPEFVNEVIPDRSNFVDSSSLVIMVGRDHHVVRPA